MRAVGKVKGTSCVPLAVNLVSTSNLKKLEDRESGIKSILLELEWGDGSIDMCIMAD